MPIDTRQLEEFKEEDVKYWNGRIKHKYIDGDYISHVDYHNKYGRTPHIPCKMDIIGDWTDWEYCPTKKGQRLDNDDPDILTPESFCRCGVRIEIPFWIKKRDNPNILACLGSKCIERFWYHERWFCSNCDKFYRGGQNRTFDLCDDCSRCECTDKKKYLITCKVCCENVTDKEYKMWNESLNLTNSKKIIDYTKDRLEYYHNKIEKDKKIALQIEKQNEIDEDNKYFTKGKHEGKKFKVVYYEFAGYVKWGWKERKMEYLFKWIYGRFKKKKLKCWNFLKELKNSSSFDDIWYKDDEQYQHLYDGWGRLIS